MIEDAEKSGRIKPGDTLIEPTSGNTGIGLGLAGAVKGYKVIITQPDKMSKEKVSILEAQNAKVIRTPTEALSHSDESHIGVAKRLNKEIPNSHILDQYSNRSNFLAHYEGTAKELVEQMNNDIDYVFIGAGTGGTITGISQKVKETVPKAKIIGVDPYGSLLAESDPKHAVNNTEIGSYQVEGIGYDFVPEILNYKNIDDWVKTQDTESFIMARMLISKEGQLCGGSSGSCLAGAVKYCKKNNIGKGSKIVIILPDSLRNYITKFIDVDWLTINNHRLDTKYDTYKWSKYPISKLEYLYKKVTNYNICYIDITLERYLKQKDNKIVFVVKDTIKLDENTAYNNLNKNDIIGVLYIDDVLQALVDGRLTKDDNISRIIKKAPLVESSTTLGYIATLFKYENIVYIIENGLLVGTLMRTEFLDKIVNEIN